MVVALSRDGEVFLERDLEWGGERWHGEIEIEAGDYEIQLEAYKAAEVRWRGEVEVAVRRGERRPVEIQLDRLHLLQISLQSLDLGSEAALGEFRVSNGGSASASLGDGGLRWQVEEGAGWLTVTASGIDGSTDDGALSGEGNVALVAQVSREGLQGGIYSTELRVRSNGGDAVVPVRMTVPSIVEPVLAVTPLELSVGGGVEEHGLLVSNSGSGVLDWQVEETADWLEVGSEGGDTGSGTLEGEGGAELTVRTSGVGLASGIYQTMLRIRSNGGEAIVPVRMTVEVEEPPPPPSGETLVAELPGGAQMEFVWVERGGFWMGSPVDEPGHSINEGPRHWVNIGEGFYIGRYEVTQAQWTGAMASNPSRFGGNERPVDSVSWADAQAFVHQLNVAAGDSLYRLPTEAEWEYAARAGTDTPWSFGNDEEVLGEYAWYEGNDDTGETRDVGLKQPNPWGLYDVHGNVWEWVQDWYGEQYYGESPEADPPGPATGSARVMRGGAFNHGVSFLRSADRLRFDPTVRSSNVGIRLVRVR